MSLTRYQRNRDFERTPEPAGRIVAGKGPLRFVVQMHHASRLHFDFRLEADGVLKSWAVPKGPSLDPADKRLAIMVEDHPLDYGSFEGVIPPRNYGAGKVVVWDNGTYGVPGASKRADVERRVNEGLEKGHLSIVLAGKKLKGEFSLVKFPRGNENSWLLVKKEDEFAEPNFVPDDRSVLSGSRLEAIGNGKAGPKKLLANGKARPGRKRTARRDGFVKPMLATLVEKPFDRDDWIFEIKWDGYRAIAEVNGSRVRLYSRNQQSFSNKYPAIVASLAELGVHAIFDGEIVVLDEQGKSQFQLLQNYGKSHDGALVYYIFDLLSLDGKDLRPSPLRQRQTLLEGLIAGKSNLLISEHVERDGTAFFDAVARQGLEGIVAKNAESEYREATRGLDWLKIKVHQRQEAVIGGFTRPRGSRTGFGSLVLGVYEGDRLDYIGHVGTGFDAELIADIKRQLDPLQQQSCPFEQRPQTNSPAQWVRPALVCEVKFQGVSRDGHLRHPVFVGLRTDKDAHSVHREVPVSNTPAKRRAPSAKSRPRQRTRALPAAESSIRLTNLDKIYWPDEGFTKGDVVEYYRDVAPVILPYLRDRPEVLHRHPNGIRGASFFQKDLTRQLPPDPVETVAVKIENQTRKILAPLCQNLDSLLYLANLGCIEINPWNSRIEQIDRPDYLIIDLDPQEVPFTQVVETALKVREILERAGTDAYCKTSGKRGLHIYVPLGACCDYTRARQFAEVVAASVHEELPQITSIVRQPSKRRGLIYLDYLQNSRGQTVAAPYSARPYPGATVSTPLKWSEVNRRLDPGRYTIHSTRRRLDRIGDIWGPVIGPGIDLDACLERLRLKKARRGEGA